MAASDETQVQWLQAELDKRSNWKNTTNRKNSRKSTLDPNNVCGTPRTSRRSRSRRRQCRCRGRQRWRPLRRHQRLFFHPVHMVTPFGWIRKKNRKKCPHLVAVQLLKGFAIVVLDSFPPNQTRDKPLEHDILGLLLLAVRPLQPATVRVDSQQLRVRGNPGPVGTSIAIWNKGVFYCGNLNAWEKIYLSLHSWLQASAEETLRIAPPPMSCPWR